jgi:uncharacterized protein (DUF934 family)
VLPERVIRRGRVEPERWRFLGLDAEEPIPEALPAGPIAVPLAAWKARRAELLARREPVGVWLAAGDDPAALAADAASLPLIAVHFPRFTDGRGYSAAVLLRTRHGYRGELRAFGDVGRDQLFYLKRSGFDAFSLAPHRDPESALAGLEDFSLHYQGSVDDPVPLFRKRLAARGARG